MGILDKLERTLSRTWRRFGKTIKMSFKRKAEEHEDQIPQQWATSKRVKTIGSKTQAKYVMITKRKIRIGWLRQTKRILAAITLAINFLFAEFILGSQFGFQWLSILFFLNGFFILDYLWKTRRKPE